MATQVFPIYLHKGVSADIDPNAVTFGLAVYVYDAFAAQGYQGILNNTI